MLDDRIQKKTFIFLLAGLILFLTSHSYALQLIEAYPHLQFKNPTDFQVAKDGTDRVFVVEQRGVIRVFMNHSKVVKTKTFLDIRDQVLFGGEQGLLGLAFHPKFLTNGYFFLNFTASNPRRTVIARFKVNRKNPNKAVENSGVVILQIKQPYGNHNGGQLAFGPDGYLYIAVGDGGAGGDPHNHGQRKGTLLGNILRIDVDRKADGKNYAIPKSNPFIKDPNSRDEIFAYGLRNPWRMSFDPKTKKLWAADVGQNKIEEVNIIRKGKNYGWPTMEGTSCFKPSIMCAKKGLELPVTEYTHKQGQSITGGYVYRGKTLKQLIGKYIYADFLSGKIWSYDKKNKSKLLLKSGQQISSFGVDRNQELYVLSFNGKIYKLSK